LKGHRSRGRTGPDDRSYEHPKSGPSIWLCRGEDGTVILYSLNKIEAHRFSSEGKYLGPLGRKGQGPGEFPQAFKPAFFGRSIFGFTTTKMIQFDLEGRLIREVGLKIRPDWIVGEDRYLNVKQVPDGNDLTSILQLVRFNPAKSGEEQTRALRGRNLGAIKKPGSAAGFAGERWGTPNFVSASDPIEKRIYTGFNTEYKIEVRNDSGKVLSVIERPYQNIRISKEDVEFLFRSISLVFQCERSHVRLIQDAFRSSVVIRASSPSARSSAVIASPSRWNSRSTSSTARQYLCLDPAARHSHVQRPVYRRLQRHRAEGRLTFTEYHVKNLPIAKRAPPLWSAVMRPMN
jgi:hypothetical protein